MTYRCNCFIIGLSGSLADLHKAPADGLAIPAVSRSASKGGGETQEEDSYAPVIVNRRKILFMLRSNETPGRYPHVHVRSRALLHVPLHSHLKVHRIGEEHVGFSLSNNQYIQDDQSLKQDKDIFQRSIEGKIAQLDTGKRPEHGFKRICRSSQSRDSRR